VGWPGSINTDVSADVPHGAISSNFSSPAVGRYPSSCIPLQSVFVPSDIGVRFSTLIPTAALAAVAANAHTDEEFAAAGPMTPPSVDEGNSKVEWQASCG